MNKANTTIKGAQRLIVRPYDGIDTLASALELSELVLDGARFGPGNVTISPESLPFKEGELCIFADVSGISDVLESAGISPSLVWLSCIAFGSVVAESSVIFSESIVGIESPLSVPLTKAPLIFESLNGFDVRIFLHLAAELEPSDFRPVHESTWLAHEEFSVAPHATLSRFSPIPLDDRIRRQLQLPLKSLSYVRVGAGILEAESLEDEVEVFLDLDVLRLLQERPGDSLSVYVQQDLVASTLCTVITQVASMLELGDELLTISGLVSSRSPIGLMVSAIASAGGLTPDALLQAALEDPGLVRVCVECRIESLKRTSVALRDIS